MAARKGSPRRREVEVLLQATAALNAAETQETVIRIVAERAVDLCGAEMASINLLDTDRPAYVQVHRDGRWEAMPYQSPSSGSILARVAASGQTYRSNNLAADPYSDHAFDAHMGFRTQLTVAAVGSGGRVLGVVSLYNKAGDRPFTAHDATLLESLAMQAAIALDRARSRADLARTLAALRASEEQLARQAFSDALTGLPNRALFMNRLAAALERSRGAGQRVAVMLIDLDRFKVVNDSLGHDAGDRLLVTIAARLGALLPSGSLVARLGGDEFTVLLRDACIERDVLPLAEQIVCELAAPVRIGGRDVVVGASVGIALGRDETADDLLRRADLAMYRAKEEGKGRAVVFDAGFEVQARQRLELEADLRRALRDGSLEVVYQPEWDLTTATVTGAEALLRWQHPSRGPVPPDLFIPIAEQTDLIHPLGRWVLDRACRQTRAWQERLPAGAPPFGVSVNVSAAQIQHPGFADEVAGILCGSGLAPAALTLEITERALLADVERGAQTLGRLRALGVRIALDDFGTGYSALGFLGRYPIDVLKIDRSFVEGVATSATSAALVETILGLSRALGLVTVAEGIEHAGQWQRLLALGCPRGQGYHLGRPSPPATFAAFLRLADLAA